MQQPLQMVHAGASEDAKLVHVAPRHVESEPSHGPQWRYDEAPPLLDAISAKLVCVVHGLELADVRHTHWRSASERGYHDLLLDEFV